MSHSSDSPVVDFGAHFHTEDFGNFGRIHDELGARGRDPAAYADWFESNGIDHAVLSQTYLVGHDDREKTARANDDLLAVLEDHETFFGLAALPVAAGVEEAAAELERCLENGYHGGAIVRETDGVELTGGSMDPVFEVADETGAPLFVHPTVKSSLRENVLDDEYGNNHIFGREAAYCGSINKLVHSDILDRYPDLNLVYHHLGGNFASMLGRLHLRFDVPWDDLGEEMSFQEFTDRLEERVYLDTSGYYSYPGPLRAALEQFPSSQLLMGTDAPYEPRTGPQLQKYVTSVEDACSDADARRVLGENALDLLVNV